MCPPSDHRTASLWKTCRLSVARSPHDLDLSDALDPNNDPKRGGKGSTISDKDNPKGGKGTDFSDSDLDGIVDGDYKPDKGKGRRPADDDNYDNTGNLAETGTIAGIASALVMALVGAVSSYISYQQKKFCFSIQQGLNAEYVKGENMEAVMAEEPPVKYSALEAQSAAPPSGDPSKVLLLPSVIHIGPVKIQAKGKTPIEINGFVRNPRKSLDHECEKQHQCERALNLVPCSSDQLNRIKSFT
ncbi:hypothetical protein GDO81_003443 [Engystomops pustulosus]|uniref:CD99 antigen-like protein 2 n=1 Tax=Engystomops pustulosus TaxID=76066 RepID=A0AAV6ZYE6_ENGPU|nr:hypothetical protein GDO81_003443 [Engystomops pustulosus]